MRKSYKSTLAVIISAVMMFGLTIPSFSEEPMAGTDSVTESFSLAAEAEIDINAENVIEAQDDAADFPEVEEGVVAEADSPSDEDAIEYAAEYAAENAEEDYPDGDETEDFSGEESGIVEAESDLYAEEDSIDGTTDISDISVEETSELEMQASENAAGLSALTPEEWLRPYAVLNAFEKTGSFMMGGNSYSDGWECRLEYQGNSTSNKSELNYNLEKLFSYVSFDVGGTRGNGDLTAVMTIEVDGIVYREEEIVQGKAPRSFTVPTTNARHLRIAFSSDMDAAYYAVANMTPVPSGTLPEKAHESSNWRWNAEPISSTNVYERNPISFGGRTYDDAFKFELAYKGNSTSDLAYMSFNLKKHYRFMSFDVGFIGFNGTNPVGGDHADALLTITKDDNSEEIPLFWNDVPRTIWMDVTGVTNLEIRMFASGTNTRDYGLGALNFDSDGIVTGIRLEESGKTINLNKTDYKTELHPHVVPADTLQNGVKWSSADEKIAYVDPSGVVWARGNGKTTVNATTEDAGDGGPFSQSVTVNVSGINKLDPPLDLKTRVSDRGKLTAVFTPRSGASGYIFQYSTDRTFSSYKEIRVNAGDLSASDDGEAKRQYSWEFDGNGAAKGYVRAASFYTLGDYEVVGNYHSQPSEVTFAYYAERDGWCIPNTYAGFGDEYYSLPVHAWTETYGVMNDALATYLGNIAVEACGGISTRLNPGAFGGNCFGIALLSAANYNRKIDLKQIFNRDGDGLAEYGFHSIILTMRKKEAFSVKGNSEALSLIEHMMVSQASIELRKADLNWDFADLRNYLNDPDSAKPVLVTLEAGSFCHALVIYPSGEKISGDHFTVPVYDPNFPIGRSRLSQPASSYFGSSSLSFDINPAMDKFTYHYQTNDESGTHTGNRSRLAHKNIHFYDVNKLPSDYYNGELTMRSIGAKMLFGSNISDISVSSNGSSVLAMKGGNLDYLADGYDYVPMALGIEGNGVLRLLPLNAGMISYTTSSPGTVALSGSNREHAYAITATANTTVNCDPDKGTITIIGNEPGETTVSLSLGEEDNLSAEVKVNLQKGEQMTLEETGGDIAVTPRKEKEVRIAIVDGRQTLASGTVTVPGGAATYINTSKNKIEKGRSEPEKGREPKTTPSVPAAGSKLSSSSDNYTVREAGISVLYSGPKKKSVTKITVPDQIKIGTITYNVVGIADGACSGLKKLKTVTIGKKVTAIGKQVFENCKKLKTVIIRTSILKSVGSKAFNKSGSADYRKLTITVPKAEKKAYTKMLKKAKLNKKARIKSGA